MALLQLRVDLLHRLEADTHDDEDRGATEREVLVGTDRGEGHERQERNQAEVDGARQRDARQDSAVGRPARMPGMKPPYFFMLSATSTGLKVMAT